MRVRIAAHGREVTVECGDANVSAKDIAAEALVLWKATGDGKSTTDGAAVGFVADRRGSRSVSPTHLGGRYVGEVDA